MQAKGQENQIPGITVSRNMEQGNTQQCETTQQRAMGDSDNKYTR